jgi:hypothetical protein
MKMSYILPTCPVLRKITDVLHIVESLKTERHIRKWHNIVRKTRFKGWFSMNDILPFMVCFRSRGTISSPYRFSSSTWGIVSFLSYFIAPFCRPFLFYVLPSHFHWSSYTSPICSLLCSHCCCCFSQILCFMFYLGVDKRECCTEPRITLMQRHENSKALLLIDWLNVWRRGNMFGV